ncbi:hypothetical protein [Clostridioides difficile]|nr:hypothetical protein [Clostridioides difficile]
MCPQVQRAVGSTGVPVRIRWSVTTVNMGLTVMMGTTVTPALAG